ncbi:MAG: hypothetical protein SVV03_06460 [Candidatus Nanohaloarchaea archaeon]|nr:hypothetical protein [Candidatus Nanohaloarchaea archaeon]
MALTSQVLGMLAGIGFSREILMQKIVPLATFVAGMVLYSIFVFRLYKFIAQKDIFKLDLAEYASGFELFKNFFKLILYILEYLLFFPVLTIAWFVVFAGLLALLSSTHTVESLMLVSIAVVTTIRVCAYYNSALAEDVGKTLPLALLGIVLVDGFKELSVSRAIDIGFNLAGKWEVVLYYLGFVIVLELVLRLLTIIFRGTVETEDEGEGEGEDKEGGEKPEEK